MKHVTNLSVEDRMYIVGKLHEHISSYFAHWDDCSFSRETSDDVFRWYLNQAIEANSREQFVWVLKQWIGRLNNAHSWCTDLKRQDIGFLGFQLERTEVGWMVVKSRSPQVHVGDVVETIQALTPDAWMKKAGPILTSTNQALREAQWQFSFPYLHSLSHVDLRIRRELNKVIDVYYELDAYHALNDFESGDMAQTTGTWLVPEAIAYLRIPSFAKPHFEESALECVRRFVNAKTLILDLRWNMGGVTPGALIEALMERTYRWWMESASNIGFLKRRHVTSSAFSILEDGSGARVEGEWFEPDGCVFPGQVVLLTSRYTGSAAEDFAMTCKDTGRGVLIGERTGGSTGQPIIFEHEGIQIGVGAIRANMPDGTPFESSGIYPDITVETSWRDIVSRRDVVLDSALAYAKGGV